MDWLLQAREFADSQQDVELLLLAAQKLCLASNETRDQFSKLDGPSVSLKYFKAHQREHYRACNEVASGSSLLLISSFG